jgi:hypothetical protein
VLYLIVSSKETIKSAYNPMMASMLQLMLSLWLNATLALAIKRLHMHHELLQ